MFQPMLTGMPLRLLIEIGFKNSSYICYTLFNFNIYTCCLVWVILNIGQVNTVDYNNCCKNHVAVFPVAGIINTVKNT